jgi:hypothetical protein
MDKTSLKCIYFLEKYSTIDHNWSINHTQRNNTMKIFKITLKNKRLQQTTNLKTSNSLQICLVNFYQTRIICSKEFQKHTEYFCQFVFQSLTTRLIRILKSCLFVWFFFLCFMLVFSFVLDWRIAFNGFFFKQNKW